MPINNVSFSGGKLRVSYTLKYRCKKCGSLYGSRPPICHEATCRSREIEEVRNPESREI